MSGNPKAAAVSVAMGVARDVAEGRVDATELHQVAVAECRRLFATVIGGDDPLFGLQVEVARRVLDRGGLSVDELAEWVTVLRRREDTVRAAERDANGSGTEGATVSDDEEHLVEADRCENSEPPSAP